MGSPHGHRSQIRHGFRSRTQVTGGPSRIGRLTSQVTGRNPRHSFALELSSAHAARPSSRSGHLLGNVLAHRASPGRAMTPSQTSMASLDLQIVLDDLTQQEQVRMAAQTAPEL